MVSTLSQANITDKDVPTELKDKVTLDEWNGFPLEWKKECRKIIQRPNAYFFRYRPPWEVLKHGAFSKEEERQFYKRYRYFRNVLNLNVGQWGLFSIKLKGRVGYQVSSYYKNQVKMGKIIEPINPTDKTVDRSSLVLRNEFPPDKLALLRNEAYDFIAEEIKTNFLAKNKHQPDTNTDNSIRKNIKIPDTYAIEEEKKKELIKEVEKEVKKSDIFIKQKLFEKTIYIPRREEKILGKLSPLKGALDPLTKRPMIKPTMNLEGYVMDYDSWIQVLDGKEVPPFDSLVEGLDELTVITEENFDKLKSSITNIPC